MEILPASDFADVSRKPNLTTLAHMSTDKVVYVCQWGWWAVSVLACLLMMVIASVGAVLRRGLHGPDILGYVSSMTRDSPYVRLPPGGSALDGTERAWLLRHLQVQLRDVHEGRDIGRLAFASLEGGQKPFVAGRKYE